jgi:alkylation response protein AidB-like acyl-CoA dehydrogenase
MCVCKVKGEPGLSQLIIEKEVSPFRTRELDKLGLQASPTSELCFENCRVPAENLVVPGKGLKQTLQGFERARSMLAIGAVGISQTCLEAALTYAKERQQWGKPLAGHQTIQHMVAEMDTLTDAARFIATPLRYGSR